MSLHLAESLPLTLALDSRRTDEDDGATGGARGPVHVALLAVLDGGGAFFFRALADAVAAAGVLATESVVAEALWDLVFDGLVSSDTLAPLRARIAGGRTTHRARAATPRARMRSPSGLALLSSRRMSGMPAGGRQAPSVRPGTPPSVVGRWSRVPGAETDPTLRLHAAAEVLLDRHGVVTRGAVMAEGTPGGFAGVYRVLSALEETGRIRRGYFVEGLGAAQFATAGAVDRVRSFATRPDSAESAPVAVVLAAADPANPYGAALPWPERPDAPVADRHRPARRAGALVVLVDGSAVLFAERGGRSLLSFGDDPLVLAAGAAALAELVTSGRVGALTVAKVDGVDAVAAAGPVVDALVGAGFAATPRGLRLRGARR